MPRKSMDAKASKKALPLVPKFANEAKEADWYRSPEGRRWLVSAARETSHNGIKIVDGALAFSQQLGMVRKASRQGARFKRRALDLELPEPAKLQELVDRAKLRSQPTRAISLRLPVSDLEALKLVAAKAGVGYQALIKEAVHDLLRRIS